MIFLKGVRNVLLASLKRTWGIWPLPSQMEGFLLAFMDFQTNIFQGIWKVRIASLKDLEDSKRKSYDPARNHWVVGTPDVGEKQCMEEESMHQQ